MISVGGVVVSSVVSYYHSKYFSQTDFSVRYDGGGGGGGGDHMIAWPHRQHRGSDHR